MITVLGGLNEGEKIVIASSAITFAISSIVFFIFGYLCHHYRQKSGQTPTPAPLYEDVLQQQNPRHDMELQENVAYGPINRNY